MSVTDRAWRVTTAEVRRRGGEPAARLARATAAWSVGTPVGCWIGVGGGRIRRGSDGEVHRKARNSRCTAGGQVHRFMVSRFTGSRETCNGRCSGRGQVHRFTVSVNLGLGGSQPVSPVLARGYRAAREPVNLAPTPAYARVRAHAHSRAGPKQVHKVHEVHSGPGPARTRCMYGSFLAVSPLDRGGNTHATTHTLARNRDTPSRRALAGRRPA